jgi:hypothetical protein
MGASSDTSRAIETLGVVEKSLNESSQEPLQQGQGDATSQTAYEISKLEQNANTVLGLFLQMIAKHVKDFGKLRLGDILQYLTVAEVKDITGNPELAYKTIFIKGNQKGGKNKKIDFTKDMPEEMTEEENLNASYDIMTENKKKNMEINKVNPQMFRELQYMITVAPDTLNPRSEDLERAFSLELFDRAINFPNVFDPEEIGKLLLSTNPDTKKDVEKYIVKQAMQSGMPPMMGPDGQPMQPGQPKGQMPNAGNSPLGAMTKKSPLSPTSSNPALAGMMGK